MLTALILELQVKLRLVFVWFGEARKPRLNSQEEDVFGLAPWPHCVPEAAQIGPLLTVWLSEAGQSKAVPGGSGWAVIWVVGIWYGLELG